MGDKAQLPPGNLDKPKAAKGAKKKKKKRTRAPRTSRRPEEDVPAVDYVEILEKLGPRKGESILAFRKRMGIVIAARKLWVETWLEHDGDQATCAEALGIPRSNNAYELRFVGLSADILNRLLREERWKAKDALKAQREAEKAKKNEA
jgi:hypothetical protein